MPISLLPQAPYTILTALSLDVKLGRTQKHEQGQGLECGCVAKSISSSSSVLSAALNAPERNSGSNWYGALFGSLVEAKHEKEVKTIRTKKSKLITNFGWFTSSGTRGKME